VDQGITQEPSGFGSRQSIGKPGVQKITGTIKRDYDEAVVDTASGQTFMEDVQAFQMAAMTAMYLRVYINPTGLHYTFYPVYGTYTPNGGSVDGIVTEQYDFTADAMYTT
jgi:hypothetical protein